jgi:hypothetical protein
MIKRATFRKWKRASSLIPLTFFSSILASFTFYWLVNVACCTFNPAPSLSLHTLEG